MDIPGYQVRRTIGRGGMATAYLAVQDSLQRDVVLKVMNSDQSESKDFLERFVNEGRIVAGLRHPHIITIFDIGRAGDLVFIAMEYVEGGDLKHVIDHGMSPDEALGILCEIAEALGYAHERGIIHRDVKPANILFRNDGTPLLSDFGIAKQIQANSELTSTGTILGSPFYMSPEQAEGMVVDGRTDLYSLGVIFYEMLTGERPYQGDSAIKVIMQHIQSPMPKLPEHLAEFQPLLECMMAKDRDHRVSDANLLVNEIQAIREARENGEPVPELGEITNSSMPAVTVSTKPDDSGKRKLGLALGAVVLVAAAIYVGFLVLEAMKPPELVRKRTGGADTAVTDVGTNLRERSGTMNLRPEVPPGGVDQADVVRALSWLARNSLNEDRLTHPPADNAYYYYSRLLAMDPGNTIARDGLSNIAERFVVLAEQEFSRKNYAKAQAYIVLGLQIEPDNEGLSSLQTFINDRKKGFFETLMELI